MTRNISHRERLLLAVTVAVVVVTGLWVGAIEPAVERRETLERKIETKRSELAEVRALAVKHAVIKERFDRFRDRIAAQPAGHSPLSYMESLAASAGVKDNIISMVPQPGEIMEGFRESPVSVKLEKVTLGRLVSFLKAAREGGIYLRVKRVSIKPQYEDPELLNVTLLIAGYEEAE